MGDDFSPLDLSLLCLNEAVWLPYVSPIFIEGLMHQWWKRFGFDVYEEVEDAVDRVKQEYGTEKVNLVGHSLGGLESLVYTLNNPDNVDNCVPVAAPVSGTSVAYAGFISLAFGFYLPSTLDLVPTSDYMKKVKKRIKEKMPVLEDKAVKVTNIWSPVDELVAIGGCSIEKVLGRKSPALREIKYNVGHCAIFYNENTNGIIKDIIRESEYPTILLHGLTMNKRFFDLFISELDPESKEKVTAISYDYLISRKI